MANLITIPAGTPAARCSKCPATIYWVITDKGKRSPVSVNTAIYAGCFPPTETREGQGVSHFADCPAAAGFRRGGRHA